MKAKFALFDLDDTLVATAEAFRAFSRELVLAHGLGGDDVAAATDRVMRDRMSAESWRGFVTQAREWYGIETPPAEFYDWILATYPTKFTLDPQVAKGLTGLREDGWRMAIVTNGSTEVQQSKIDHAGVRGYVDFVIDSDTAGQDKPARRIFDIAAEGLGVELGPHGWMVGDNHANDIVGGHGVGLRTIWLPYDAEQPADAVRPDVVCGTILEAIAVIAGE